MTRDNLTIGLIAAVLCLDAVPRGMTHTVLRQGRIKDRQLRFSRSELSEYCNWLAKGYDYRIGVVSSDMGSPHRSGSYDVENYIIHLNSRQPPNCQLRELLHWMSTRDFGLYVARRTLFGTLLLDKPLVVNTVVEKLIYRFFLREHLTSGSSGLNLNHTRTAIMSRIKANEDALKLWSGKAVDFCVTVVYALHRLHVDFR